MNKIKMKIIFIFLSILMFHFFIYSQALDRIGIEVGPSFGHVYGSDINTESFGAGISCGINLEADINDYLSFQSGIMFIQKIAVIEEEETQGGFTNTYTCEYDRYFFEIPLLFKITSSLKEFLFSFLFGGGVDISPGKFSSADYDDIAFDINLQIGVEPSVKLGNGCLFFRPTYLLGLISAKTSYLGNEVRNGTILLLFGYSFNLN